MNVSALLSARRAGVYHRGPERLYAGAMNYLAHLYFSDLTPDGCVGQLLPDCMPPRQLPESATATLRQHVHLHQVIDRFTDHHDQVLALRRSFEPPFRRFSGVILDVLFDHILARTWSDWHDTPLDAFSAQVYTALAAYRGPENERLRSLRLALVQHRWLPGYGTREGMARALSSLDRRSRFNTPLATAVQVLDQRHDDISAVFSQFFPQLQAEVRRAQTDGSD